MAKTQVNSNSMVAKMLLTAAVISSKSEDVLDALKMGANPNDTVHYQETGETKTLLSVAEARLQGGIWDINDLFIIAMLLAFGGKLSDAPHHEGINFIQHIIPQLKNVISRFTPEKVLVPKVDLGVLPQTPKIAEVAIKTICKMTFKACLEYKRNIEEFKLTDSSINILLNSMKINFNEGSTAEANPYNDAASQKLLLGAMQSNSAQVLEALKMRPYPNIIQLSVHIIENNIQDNQQIPTNLSILGALLAFGGQLLDSPHNDEIQCLQKAIKNYKDTIAQFSPTEALAPRLNIKLWPDAKIHQPSMDKLLRETFKACLEYKRSIEKFNLTDKTINILLNSMEINFHEASTAKADPYNNIVSRNLVLGVTESNSKKVLEALKMGAFPNGALINLDTKSTTTLLDLVETRINKGTPSLEDLSILGTLLAFGGKLSGAPHHPEVAIIQETIKTCKYELSKWQIWGSYYDVSTPKINITVPEKTTQKTKEDIKSLHKEIYKACLEYKRNIEEFKLTDSSINILLNSMEINFFEATATDHDEVCYSGDLGNYHNH